MHHLRKLRPLFWTALLSLAAAAPATAPGNASPPQTGDITLKFTQRSPLSSRKEIARRLSCKESDLGDDYDLTTYPFNAYIPPNYDPSTPYGVFVFLANKDVNTVATRWEPLFDKSHMIYIAPYYHPNGTPEWQSVGLGFDAIDNLKRLYNIDTHRLYDMWVGSGSIQKPLAGADVYTGMIVTEDWGYFRKIDLPGHRYIPAAFPQPPLDLLPKAKSHGVILLYLVPPDPGVQPFAMALKEDGFAHVLSVGVAVEEMHFATLGAGWITDPGLPFLDKFAQNSPDTPTDSDNPTPAPPPPADTTAAASPTTSPSRTSPSASSQAQHLLHMAKLYIDNGNTELARAKLQTILTSYPNDPAAIPAKKLLDSLPPPSPPQ